MHSSQLLPFKDRQRGAVLLLGLVVLTLMTLFAISAMTDVGIQTSMVRNNQLEMLAYNNSQNEINAQIDNINTNNEEDILLDALNASDGVRELTDGSNVSVPVAGTTETTEVPTDDEILTDDGSDFTVAATMTYLRDQALVSGYSLGEFRGLVFELDVDSERAGTASKSEQVQGLYYIAPL